MTFIQIDSKVKKLTPIEAFVLGFITSKAGKKGSAIITLGLIAKVCSGKVTAKTKATASKYVYTLEENGFIKIENRNKAGKLANKYTVVKPTNFVEINYDIFLPEYNMISPKAKGLFIKMATIAYKDSGLIDYTDAKIYKELGLAKNTYYKLVKELIETDLVVDKCLSDAWFKKTDLKKVKEENRIKELELKIESCQEEIMELCKVFKNGHFVKYDYDCKYYKALTWCAKNINKKYNKAQRCAWLFDRYQSIITGEFFA